MSHSSYLKIIKMMNISFVKLGEEECEDCDLHERHLIDVRNLADRNDRMKLVDDDRKKYEKVFFFQTARNVTCMQDT